jgi:hypothetical protein
LGKRSDYKRVPQDLYETPLSAVTALLPWLEPATRFVEPCVGRGALAEHLKRAGHILVGAHDLPDDARVMRYSAFKDDNVVAISNPPYWGRPRDLHALIGNVSDQATFWALLQHDWLANAGSGEIGSRVRRIVPVGRVKLIPDSPSTGMDNVVWVKFTRPSDEPAVFVFRDPQAKPRPARALRKPRGGGPFRSRRKIP